MVLELSCKKYSCGICHKSYDRRIDAEECERCCEKARKIENIERLKTFEIKIEHLKLLNAMYVNWDDCEFGAPCIDCKRPYGNSSGVNDVAEVIGLKKTKDNVDGYNEKEANEYDDWQDYIDDLEWNDETYNYLYYLHRETQIALQICLVTGKFEKGKYKKTEEYDSTSWVKVE